MSNPFREQISQYGMDKPDAYTPYAAGAKTYGPAGSTAPTIGPVENQGYQERDQRANAMRQAWLNRLQAQQSGELMSGPALSGPGVM